VEWRDGFIYSSLNANANTNAARTELTRRNIMNIAKNMEAIFIAAVALAGAASIATAAVPAAPATIVAAKAATAATAMPVVTITAKRLSAAEKAALAN
jgi:hypothetical protein